MTTFRKIPVKSEIEGDEPLSDYAIAYLNERVRNAFYDYVLRRFEDEAKRRNLTKAQLARRLGLGPDRMSKILGAPGNWTLDTISELLIGICREELTPSSVSYLGRPKRNTSGSDLLRSLGSRPREIDEPQSGDLKPNKRRGSSAIDAAKYKKEEENNPQYERSRSSLEFVL